MDYSKILLVSDVDSTLAVGGEISEENKKAIRYFVENGGKFTLATGRTPAYILEKYGDTLPISAPVAAVNGSIVADLKSGDILWSKPMPAAFTEVLRFAMGIEHDLRCLLYRADQTEDVSDKAPVYADGYYKILFVLPSAERALSLKSALTAEFSSDFELARSWDIGLEATCRGADKGAALLKIKKMTGCETAIGVGNYENDLRLLTCADVGIAVENAEASLKRAADFVTVSDKDHAVAEIIYHLEQYLKN